MSHYIVSNKRGSAILDFVLAMSLLTLLIIPSIKYVNTLSTQTQVNGQQYKVSMLGTAIKNNTKLIMDASMTVCSAITNATANDGWGWRLPACQHTSPFPIYTIANNVLTYNIDVANFGSTVNSIISNIGGSCSYTGQTATTVTFNCAGVNVTGIQYKTSTGPVSNTYADTVNLFTTPHTNSTNADFLNFLDFPTAVFIQYNVYFSDIGSTINHNDMLNGSDVSKYAWTVDMTDLFFDRSKKSRDNVLALQEAFRGYVSSTRLAEFANVPPNGLAGNDSFFVPWMWQALATTSANTKTLCSSPSCPSIVSGTQWATAAQASSFAEAWILLTANLMSSNLTYTVDAFGNPLRIVVVANACTGDVSTCIPSGASGSNPPPLPQASYQTALTTAGYTQGPPYNSLIVSPLCMAAGTAYSADWCRWIVVGPS